ncbi:Oxygen-regulated invasion protein OrgA [Pseudomonas fluorescens]|uniref:Oxygen-regulated invasion protein OrgA n=1 Tax=Pseudomonas fluorescens TaxID=294 RepID=A0A5E7AP23_PSEFL|nr:secretion system protein [Pseudomonas fluorescens]VVN76353.1 Oxygen-regulated invasion protein OrgA [Pseudomonas fluorescens]
MSHAECLRRILVEPLFYLHPQRLTLPAGFDGPEARDLLNGVLLEGLETGAPPATPLTAVAKQWVLHWRHLPYIARLMGAYRLMPDLAQGAALLRLPLSLRQFAGYRLGARSGPPMECLPVSVEQVEAAGLNALWSWCAQVPPLLLERLILQFSEPVVRLHRQWPITEPDPALFFLAVQHARRYPNPD